MTIKKGHGTITALILTSLILIFANIDFVSIDGFPFICDIANAYTIILECELICLNLICISNIDLLQYVFFLYLYNNTELPNTLAGSMTFR